LPFALNSLIGPSTLVMSKGDRKERKAGYVQRLLSLVEEYPRILLVDADNVRSKQLQHIRRDLRGKAEILMGKNTLIRRALRGIIADRPEIEKLLPVIRGNIGFVFTKSDLVEVRDILLANKVPAPAKAGAIAPVNVIVPAGNTMMPPEKTSFFQALKIITKIVRGTIEITDGVNLISKGDRVGASEAMLLNMLNIRPFHYGLGIVKLFDEGGLFDASVLDITEADLLKRFSEGIRNVAAVSLAIGVPTIASIPHILINNYKRVLAIALATDISFPLADQVKERINNPEAFSAVAPTAVSAPAAAGSTKAPEPAAESEEEDFGAGGMFGDDEEDF